MSIQPTGANPMKAYQQTQANSEAKGNSEAKASGESKATSASEMSAENKQQLNRSILESQLSLSMKTDNKSMSLLYRNLTDAIKDRMAEDTEAANASDGVEQKYQDEDNSPKATAERIVAFATRFFEHYQKNHPELEGEEALDGFLTLMGGAIDKGFADARNMLDGMQQLQGKVATDIDDTYSLIQQGLQDYRKRQLEAMNEAKAAAESDATTKTADKKANGVAS